MRDEVGTQLPVDEPVDSSSMRHVEVTHEPKIVFCPCISSGEGLEASSPPSPTSAIRARAAVASSASERPGVLPEQSTAHAVPRPRVVFAASLAEAPAAASGQGEPLG